MEDAHSLSARAIHAPTTVYVKHSSQEIWFPLMRRLGNLRIVLVTPEEGFLSTHILWCLSDECFRPTSSWFWGSLSLQHFLSYGAEYFMVFGARVTWWEWSGQGGASISFMWAIWHRPWEVTPLRYGLLLPWHKCTFIHQQNFYILSSTDSPENQITKK